MANKNFNYEQFEHNKNYVIEASAGTGKTYNIIKIVKNLVEKHQIDINQILIVTYTEKAAGELRDRIRKELVNVNVDSAPIYTIHSFCQNVIKEYCLSMNLPLNLNLIDENKMQDYAERYIREGEVLNSISLIKKATGTINDDYLVKTLVAFGKNYYLNKQLEEDKTIISMEFSDKLYDAYELLMKIGSASDFNNLLKIIPEMNDYYTLLKNSGITIAEEFAAKIETNYLKCFDFEKGKYSLTAFKKLNPDLLEAYQYFRNIKELLEQYKGYKIISSIYAKDFYQKWQKEKELNKNQMFDDMIRYVREALVESEDLKHKLQKRYIYAIIDEFQDTNQRQFDIFKNIFMQNEQNKIIVVGDPKQSIYSFQGADVKAYQNAVNEIAMHGGEITKLNTNFRSTSSMVQNCNYLFKHYDFAGTSFEDCGYLTKSDEKYNDVLYDGKEIQAFWIAKEENDEAITPESFAKIAVEQIIECCKKDQNGHTRLRVKSKDDTEFRNVSFKDFAVLAKVKSEMNEIEIALKKAGIPYLKYKDDKLFKGIECAHWIALLKAIDCPDFIGKNRKILKKALFTSFFGKTLEEINSVYTSKDDIDEIIMIKYWQRLVLNGQWQELFGHIIHNSNLTHKMNSLKEIQSYAIFKQIANYCMEFLLKHQSLNELIRTLENLSRGGESDDEDSTGSIIEKSTNFDCVNLMTIHASKGLQFPVVISVGGINGPKKSDLVYNIHKTNEHNESYKVLTSEHTKEFTDDTNEECKRIFYVALTRAEFILILPFYKQFGYKYLSSSLNAYMTEHPNDYRTIYSNNNSFTKLSAETSLILKKPVQDDDFDESELIRSQEDKIQQLITSSRLQTLNKYSYSSLSHGTKDLVYDEEDEENKEGTSESGLSRYDKLAKVVLGNYDPLKNPLEMPNNYPAGSQLGTALHEIFEGLDFNYYNLGLGTKIKKCFLKQGIRIIDEWEQITEKIVEEVLNANLPEIHGSRQTNNYIRLKDIAYCDKLDEVEFNFKLMMTELRNYCNGFVDLIFRKGDYYSIVDWKSDRLNEQFTSYANSEDLKAHVNDCYSIQRVLYSYCLIKWLNQAMPNKTLEEIFEQHFGGVYYIFLRGCNQGTSNGIYAQTWESWSDLEKSFLEIVKYKVGGLIND